MLVIRADSLDPRRNLAIEELCLDKVKPADRILFLWQSSDTVVIGKNQNPWLECSLAAMEQEGVKVARRLSGGGAVFHDEGNLNFAFLMPRREYDEKIIFKMVIEALHRFGVQAAAMGRSSLAVHGRKVSGSAFCYRRENVLHHGTLLISTDLDKLSRYLASAPRSIRSRAIRSNPALVANLRDMANSITVPRLADVLVETAAAEWQQPVAWGGTELFEPEVLAPLEKKYASWEWQFGMTPPFEIELSRRFTWGDAQVKLFVEKAVIRNLEVELPGKDRRIAPAIEQALIGARFSEKDIVARLRKEASEFPEDATAAFARWLACA